jgi:hypothetical protein
VSDISAGGRQIDDVALSDQTIAFIDHWSTGPPDSYLDDLGAGELIDLGHEKPDYDFPPRRRLLCDLVGRPRPVTWAEPRVRTLHLVFFARNRDALVQGSRFPVEPTPRSSSSWLFSRVLGALWKRGAPCCR